jgi:hypothetical protein
METGFLDLPGEIRNHVYTQLLVIPRLPFSRLLSRVEHRISPRILRVCRAINQEATQILYGLNIFLVNNKFVSSQPRLRLYYNPVRNTNIVSLIRRYHIRVRLDTDALFSAEQLTETFSGLDELTIDIFQARFGSSDNKVLKLFEGIRGVKKARIIGNLTYVQEYANWLLYSIMTPVGCEVTESVEAVLDMKENIRHYDMWIVRE